ncbi:MAG TPA: pro-sigmaK processing inhibitor BofA family protein [archaeon]|nr:pro-sigmaK processing inhibitor BofA family protein [archaeon]
MVSVPFLGPILAVIILVLVVYIALKLGKKVIILLINSFLGLLALAVLNLLPFISVEINIWSILIAGLGGIPGILLLVLLDVAGIAF